jgi:hypothetical protein
MIDNGWKQKDIARKDIEAFVRKGEEVAIKFDTRQQRWSWRELSKDDTVTKSPYLLGKLMVQNDNRLNPLTPFQEDDKVRNLLRENLAKGGIDIRKQFNKYIDIIEWLEFKGANFPTARNVAPQQKKSLETEPQKVPEVQATPGSNRLTEILLNETSLFKLAYELGYRAKKFENEARIPNEVIQEVRRKSNIATVAKDFLEGVEKVSETLYQAVNPHSGVKFKTLLIDEATNRFEDKKMNLEGDAITLLVAVKGMKFNDAVKSIADSLRIEVPNNKQESKNVYFSKDDSVLQILRNEETGRYYFIDYEKNLKGTAFDLVKLEMSKEKGFEVTDKSIFKSLVELAAKVLDEDRKIEMLKLFGEFSKSGNDLNLPKASALKINQELSQNQNSEKSPDRILVASIHEGSNQEFLRTEIFKKEDQFFESIQRKYQGEEASPVLERQITPKELINTLVSHIKSEMHLSWEQALGADYRQIVQATVNDNTAAHKSLSLVAFHDNGVGQTSSDLQFSYMIEVHKDNAGKFFQKVTELGQEKIYPDRAFEFREISKKEAMALLANDTAFKFIIKPEDAFGEEKSKANELGVGYGTNSITSGQYNREQVSSEISL